MATTSIDYARVGMSMTDVKRTLVREYIDAIAMGIDPQATMVWGEPGMGKTYTMYAAAKEISAMLRKPVKVVCQLTSCLEPSDITGIPTPVEVVGFGKYTEYLAPKWAWESSEEYQDWKRQADEKFEAPPMLLFWDDVVAGHQQTLNALLKGVHEGMWGGLKQRGNVMVAAAGNRIEDNAGAIEMTTALGSRFAHLYANLLTKDWLKWATDEGNIHPYIVGYIRQCGDDLREFNADVAARAEKAFACPRTWHMVSNVTWQSKNVEADDLYSRRVIGRIGLGTATKFLGYMKNTVAVVPPEDIVKDPKHCKVPSTKQLDALYATVSSLEHYIKQHPEHWEAACIYSLRKEMLGDVGVCLAITVARCLQKLPAQARTKAQGSELWLDMMERYEEMFDHTT